MIPWDYNLAFGTFGVSLNSNNVINEAIDSYKANRPMIDWVLENEEYTKMYHEYYELFIEKMYTNGRSLEIINDAYELIKFYVEKDPIKFCTYDEFEKGVKAIKQFCELRSKSVIAQLDGTIPSTTEEQKKTKNKLIDASQLKLTDMGSMWQSKSDPAKIKSEK